MAKRPTRVAAQRADGQGQITSGTGSMGAAQRGPSTAESGASAGTSADDDDFQQAKRRADEAWLAERNNVTEGRDCQRFYAGGPAQWDQRAWEERAKKRRPTLTVNRLPQFVKQLTGDVRKNPPSLKFLPARSGANQDTAEAFNGLARHIDQQSGGTACYIKAVENAAKASQGFWRITTEYVSTGEEASRSTVKKYNASAFDLDIRRRPILDPFGALIDPYCQLLDKSDMRYAFVFEQVAREDFHREYPNAAAVDVYAGVDVLKAFPWVFKDSVRIAEYWRRVPVTTKLYLLPDGAVVDDLDEVQADMPDVDFKALVRKGLIKSREVESWRVEMRKMCGSSWLDDDWTAWAGKYIPICMVSGEEDTIDGSTVRKGMVHDARDPQRIYNYTRSASVEWVSNQPRAAWVGTVDQFKGRREWETASSENHAFLAYNPDPKAPGPPQRAPPATPATGLDQQSVIAASDMEATMGIYKPSLGAPSNETSGIAIRQRQQEGDTGTFMFIDNLARAIGYEGKILADLIPRVYDTQRQVRILQADGTAQMVTVNGPPAVNQKTKEPMHPIYDLQAGEYDVVVTTGPSFATQRQEAAANMTEMIRAYPPLMQIGGDLLIKNMDWPGADELAARMRKAMGIPEDNEPPPPPSPEAQAKQAAEAASVAKDAATARKTMAEAEGQEITNAQLVMSMGAQMAAVVQAVEGIKQMLAGGAPPAGGPPPGPMPGTNMPAPPPAPPQAPAGQMMGTVMQAPPMVELSDIGGPV